MIPLSYLVQGSAAINIQSVSVYTPAFCKLLYLSRLAQRSISEQLEAICCTAAAFLCVFALLFRFRSNLLLSAAFHSAWTAIFKACSTT